MKIKERIYNILKGKFLVDDDALKHWVFIVFIAFLALLMISSSHRVDKKVQLIAKLTRQQKELRALHIATRSKLMKLKMETSVVKLLDGKGLFVANQPPVKIKVLKKVNKKNN